MNRLIVALLMASMAFRAGAATKMRLHNTASTIAGYKAMDLALGPAGRSIINSVTTSTASGTDIQLTATAGGTALAWISEPLSAGVTISGSIIANLYGGESATSVNAGFRVRVYKYSGGSEGAAILTSDMSSELNATLTTARIWSNAPSSTAFSTGDRIVVKFFITNVGGTMAAGTVTGHYEGATDAADGSSWVQIGESATFSNEGGAGGTPSIVQWVNTCDMGNTGQQLGAGGLITLQLPNVTLSGNALVLFIRCGTAATTLTPTNVGNSDLWFEGPGSRDASSTGFGLWSFYCPNASAGTRVIQVKSSAAIDYFEATCGEVANVATASALDGSSQTVASSGTSPMTPGSFTPQTSGDIIFQFTANALYYHYPTNWAPGSAGSLTWKMLSSDTHDSTGVQWAIQSSAAAINPSQGAGGPLPVELCSIGFALKSSVSGTLATGMRIVGIQSATVTIGESTNWVFQWPTVGNLKVLLGSAGANEDLTNVPINSLGDVWQACGQRSDGGVNSTRIYCVTNATAGNVNYEKFTLNSTDTDTVLFLLDIAGASATAFLTNDYKIANGNKTGTTPLTVLTYTPSSDSGIAMGVTAWDFNTGTNVNTPWKFQSGYLPVNSTGNTAYFENNGFATWDVTSASAQALTWTFMAGLGTDVGVWAASAVFFSAPAAGGGSTPVMLRKKWFGQ